MSTVRLLIANETGLHARPAALFAQTAQQFQATLLLRHSGRRVDAKNVLNILGLNVCQGAEVTLEAEGPDAEAAVQALQELVTANFEVTRFEAKEGENE